MPDSQFQSMWDQTHFLVECGNPHSACFATIGGGHLYVIRVAPWHGEEEMRGKFALRVSGEGFGDTNSVLTGQFPFVLDTLEEAKALYDLVRDKG